MRASSRLSAPLRRRCAAPSRVHARSQIRLATYRHYHLPTRLAPTCAPLGRNLRPISERLTGTRGASRGHATAAGRPDSDSFGPLQEYDRRVETGKLKNDEHQRGMVFVLSLKVTRG